MTQYALLGIAFAAIVAGTVGFAAFGLWWMGGDQ
jgi:hypothetical protein